MNAEDRKKLEALSEVCVNIEVFLTCYAIGMERAATMCQTACWNGDNKCATGEGKSPCAPCFMAERIRSEARQK